MTLQTEKTKKKMVPDMSPSTEFEKKDGTKISFANYYLNRWNMKITDLKQPLIISTPKVQGVNWCTSFFSLLLL